MKYGCVIALMALPVALAAQARPVTPAKPTTPPPNIIVMIVDDLGWQDLSVPLHRDTTAANKRYLTPAIAQLAAQGVAFTDAYAAAPSGATTRTALLTGRGVGGPGIAANTPTLPRLLRVAGYRTIHIGSTEWGPTGVSDAISMGFDESVSGARRADTLTAAAIRSMTEARTLRKPFLLYVSYGPMQPPGNGDSRFIDAARARGLDARDAAYASHIAAVDESVRALTAYLASNALDNQTLVVLMSDNGGVAAPTRSGPRSRQNAPLRSGMHSAYEGGLRIPLIVRWPGVARAGLRASTPVIAQDLFPTLLRAARVANTALLTRGMTGQDLASTLGNTNPVAYDRPLLWHVAEYSTANVPGAEPFSAVRAGIWKLIYFYVGSRYELYDLSNDVSEGREVSLKQPEIAAKLSELLRRALVDANPRMPVDSAYGRPFGLPGRLLVPVPLPPSEQIAEPQRTPRTRRNWT